MAIDCYDIQDGRAVDIQLSELNRRIDDVAAVINDKLSLLGDNLKPWGDTHLGDTLFVGDRISFATIDDIIRAFNLKVVNRGYLRPGHGVIPGTGNKRWVWWPNVNSKEWINRPDESGEYIREYAHDEAKRKKHLIEMIDKDVERVTFLKHRDYLNRLRYNFYGVYRLNKEMSLAENKCVWKRMGSSVKIKNEFTENQP